MKMKNMQKKRKLEVYELSGAGWYGQVFEELDGRWGWSLGVDFGLRSILQGGYGQQTFELAITALRLCLHLLISSEFDVVHAPGFHLVGQPAR